MTFKRKYLKRITLTLVFLFISFSVYVAIVNKNSKQMTVRQKILKAFYPALMWFTKKTSQGKTAPSNKEMNPPISFYSLNDIAINGLIFDFSTLKGKKVLLVNTASDCGYTGQYDELEKLFRQYTDKLIIIGFPANDFKEQEKGTDEDIAKFCQLNFGVTFPLMKKSSIVKSNAQNKVFKWLTDANLNGWNNRQPAWNFSKYLVNEEGKLVNYFAPAISPLDKSVTDAIDKKY